MTTKEAYQQKLEAQLKEWAAGIEVLKARAEKAKAEAKIEYMEQIDKLHSHEEAAKAKLQELKHSGEHAWEELKPGLERSWSELKSALEHARSKFH